MNYQEAIAYIETLSPTLTQPCLERVQAFVEQYGRPQERFRSLHVGGTNGKGSTVAIADSLLRASGMKIGRFTGPHLLRWNERFHVDGQPISDENFARIASEVRALSAEFGAKNLEFGPLTWFEFLTVMSFFYFAEQAVDMAVVEVGLGGRWDATNVIVPLASAITTVSLDHTQILGNTVRAIAREKAGIIKRGVPIVTATSGDALDEIRKVAEERGSRVIEVDVKRRGTEMGLCSKLSLAGEHQITNAMVAFELLNAAGIDIEQATAEAGLQGVFWPGRFQYMPKYNLLLDGAHNPAGTEALRAALEERFPERRYVFVLSCFQNKDISTMLGNLLRPGDRVIASEAATRRPTCAVDEIARVAGVLGAVVETAPSIGQALRRAMNERTTDELIVAAGSFASVKESFLELGIRSVEDSLPLTSLNVAGDAVRRG